MDPHEENASILPDSIGNYDVSVIEHKPSTGLSFPFLDGLRGIAILLVVAHHCLYLPPSNGVGGYVMAMLQAGRLGVAIFFVMSGFLMGLIVFRPNVKFDGFGFALRRAGKILPPFLLSVILSSGLWITYNNPSGLIKQCILYITTLASFFPIAANINDVYWSLLVEIHFYICLPIVYLAILRISRFPGNWTCLSMFSVPIALRTIHYLINYSNLHGWSGFTVDFPHRADAFSLGLVFSCLFYQYKGSPFLARHAQKFSIIGVFIGVVTFLAYGMTFHIQSLGALHYEALFLEAAYLFAEISTFLVLFLVFADNSFLSSVLSNRILGLVGIVSYEWYLFHFPIANWIRHMQFIGSGTVTSYIVKIGLPIFVGFAFSAFVYFFFSSPILGRIKIYLDKRKTKSNSPGLSC